MKLRFMAGPQQGRVIELQGVSLTLGRGRDNDLVLEGEGISRRHGMIVCENNSYFIEDNQSTNGVRLNGHGITQREPLRAGDKIGVGTHIIQFTDQDTAVAMPALPLVVEPLPEVSPVPPPSPAAVPWVQGTLIVVLVGCIGFVGWLTFFPPPVPPAATATSPAIPTARLPQAAPVPVPEEVVPVEEVAPVPEAAPTGSDSSPVVESPVVPVPEAVATSLPAETVQPAEAPIATETAAPDSVPAETVAPQTVEGQVPPVAVDMSAETVSTGVAPAGEAPAAPVASTPAPLLFEVSRLQAMLADGTVKNLMGQAIRVRGVPVTFGKAGNEVHLLFPGNIHCVFAAEPFSAARPAIRAAQKGNQPVIIQGILTPSTSGSGVVVSEAMLTP